MSANVANLIVLAVVLLLCYKNPRLGVLGSFLLLLGFPLSFSFFGFSFGAGEKYLPNIAIILSAYTAHYLLRAIRERAIQGLDLAIVAYILVTTVISLLVSGFALNPGVLIRQFAIYPLFYFMGRTFWSIGGVADDKYSAFRNFLLALGAYMLFFISLEYVTGRNIHAALLASFRDFVGSQVIGDPLQLLADHLRASYFRALGPQVEASETALVVGISYIAYLSWEDGMSFIKRAVRIVMQFLLLGTILLLGTRSVILMLLPLLATKESFGSAARKWRAYAYVLAGVLLLFLVVTDVGGIATGALSTLSRGAYYSERLMEPIAISGRLSAWRDAWSLIRTDFLFGVGVGTPVYVLGPGSSIYTTHNLYLDVLLFQGVVVASVLVLLWAVLIGRSVVLAREYRGHALGEMAVAHLLLVAGMLTFGLASPEKIQLSSLFWFYGGMVAAAKHQMYCVSKNETDRGSELRQHLRARRSSR
jgi:hypothetical protein